MRFSRAVRLCGTLQYLVATVSGLGPALAPRVQLAARIGRPRPQPRPHAHDPTPTLQSPVQAPPTILLAPPQEAPFASLARRPLADLLPDPTPIPRGPAPLPSVEHPKRPPPPSSFPIPSSHRCPQPPCPCPLSADAVHRHSDLRPRAHPEPRFEWAGVGRVVAGRSRGLEAGRGERRDSSRREESYFTPRKAPGQ